MSGCALLVKIAMGDLEIRRGKKKRKKLEEETMGQKYNVRICYAGHKKASLGA